MISDQQLLMLQNVLMSSFSSRQVLADFCQIRLGVDLDWIVPADATLAAQINEIIRSSIRGRKTSDLVGALFEAFPLNPTIQSLYRDCGFGTDLSLQDSGKAFANSPLASEKQGLEAIVGSLGNFGIDLPRWIEKMTTVQSRICRIEIGGSPIATGFLVGPSAVLTCDYVISDLLANEVPFTNVRCRFDHLRSTSSEGLVVPLDSKKWLLDRSPIPDPIDSPNPGKDHLDFALLQLAHDVGSQSRDPTFPGSPQRGWIEIPENRDGMPDKSLVIVFHSASGPLKITIDNQSVLSTSEDGTRMRYSANTESGAGGAPCFDIDLNPIAMHEMHVGAAPGVEKAWSQGILLGALRERLHKAGALGGALPDRATVETLPPPDPGKIIHPEDPQRDRWGGTANAGGREITAELREVSGATFLFNVSVASTDGSPLQGPVIFHLHDTYPKSVIAIRRIKDEQVATLYEVESYGVYTIGVQVKNAAGQWMGLEYCLTALDGLPERFKTK